MFSFAKKLVDRLEGHSPNQADETYFKGISHINNNGFALRVLHVQPHSAGYLAGLEAWFDYIVRINSHGLPMKHRSASTPTYSINEDGSISYGGRGSDSRASEIDYNALCQELATVASGANGVITFDVWNAKGGILRQVLVPMEQYNYTPQKLPDLVQEIFHDKFKQIGITVQSQHINTATYVWRILNTHPNSPAFHAQLIPYSDYVIGCDSSFPTDVNGKGLLAKGGEALLSKTILSYYNRHLATLGEDNVPITLYVYNHDYDILRPVTVHLSKTWAVDGNRGILGCDVGYGLLHRLPEVIGKFDQKYEKVDDVLFENKSDYSYRFSEQPKVEVQQPPMKRESVPLPASSPLSSSQMGTTAFIPDETPLNPSAISAPETYTSIASPPSVAAATTTPLISEFLPVASPAPTSLLPNRIFPSDPNATISGVTLAPTTLTPRVGVPPSIAPPKIHRKKKQHASNGISSLTDFMNEELTKSKNNDVKHTSGPDDSNPPPPPPPRSAR